MTRIFYSLVLFSLFLASCTRDQIETPGEGDQKVVSELKNEVAVEWARLYLGIETDLAGFRPAPTARAMAYIAMVGYETAIPGMSQYRSLSDALSIPNLPKLAPNTTVDYNIALNIAYKEITIDMMHSTNASQTNDILKLYESLKTTYTSRVSPDVIKASEDWGVRVARAVSKYAESDVEGHNQVRDPRPSSYTPPIGQGNWQPTAPFNGRAMFPYWGKARTFAITPEEMKVIPPPPFSTKPGDKYYDDFKEVNDAVTRNDFKGQWQAEFWSDDIVGLTFSPPARNLAIAEQLVTNEKLNLEDTVEEEATTEEETIKTEKTKTKTKTKTNKK
jgi:hypothetical protein